MAHGGKKRNVNNILVDKPRAKSRVASPSCHLEENIKIDFTA